MPSRTLLTRTRRLAVGGVLLAIALLALPTMAVAQDAAGGTAGFFNVSFGLQAASTDFAQTTVFTLNQEEGDFTAAYTVDSAPLFDIGAGVRLGNALGVGVAFSRFTKESGVSVDASLPHPFFFDQNREISGTGTGVNREENAVHIQVMWFALTSDRVAMMIFAGPTFFSVKQDVVSEVLFTEEFPFDTAEFNSVGLEEQSETALGFNVGVDVAGYFTPNVGAGVLLRFSRASVDVRFPGDVTEGLDAGGFQVAGGLRLRF